MLKRGLLKQQCFGHVTEYSLFLLECTAGYCIKTQHKASKWKYYY